MRQDASSPRRAFLIGALAAGATFASAGVRAATALPAFAPKQIKLIVGSDVGGGYDTYMRLLAQFLGRHVASRPNILVVNMPGSVSVVASNYLANVAPRDGSEVLMIVQTLPLTQLVGGPNVQFDLGAFNWIGCMADDVNVIFAMQPGPVSQASDLFTRELIVGAPGPTAIGGIYPNVMNKVLRTKFKIVYGYKSGLDVDFALERGELQGRAGASWSSLKALHADWLRDKRIEVLLQIGERKESDLADTPLLTDLTTDPDQLAVLRFYSGLTATARAIAAPPGTPPDVVAALRRAFDETMRDPDFVAEADKQHLDIRPIAGTALQSTVKQMTQTDPGLLKHFK